MLTHEEITSLDEILSSHDYDSASVIAIMQDIQKTYRYLPQEALTYIAGKLKMSEAKIYGVATFYENFSLEPKGRYVIKVCDGTACHVRKSIPILEEFRNILGLSETKHNSDDMLFTLETRILPGSLRPGAGMHRKRQGPCRHDTGKSTGTH